MSRLAAFDIGDKWTGVALSDSLRIFAKPYDTVATAGLESFLKTLLEQHDIEQCVIGYPITMHGTISQQTQKIIAVKQKLEILFPHVQWILWDERLSSKRASEVKKGTIKTKDDKSKLHAIAAAFILDSYIMFLINTSTSSSGY
jgi:putative holliday junction resolvase